MIPSDRQDFFDYLNKTFLEEWPKFILSGEQLEKWFQALSDASMQRIEKAFDLYLQDGSIAMYAPKVGKIKDILKSVPFETKFERCAWKDCPQTGDELFSIKYWFCGKHANQMHIKYFPHSTRAISALNHKKYEEEMKASGLSGYEYYKKSDPKIFEHITQKRQVDRAKENVTRSMREFLSVKIPQDERQKIIREMRKEIRSAQARNDEPILSNG